MTLFSKNRPWNLLWVIVLIFGWWWWRSPEIQSVRPANVGVKSFSVGWFTDKPAKGCVFAIPSWKLTEWLRVCENEKRKTHFLQLDNARAESSYRLLVVSGLRFKHKGALPIKLKAFNSQEAPMPQPAYGMVRSADGYLVPGALVYIYPKSEEFSYPVAGKTNMDGNYAVDLGLLENKQELLILETVASAGIWNDMTVLAKYTEPLPTITAILR